jgi:signal transduction histidine kinase
VVPKQPGKSSSKVTGIGSSNEAMTIITLIAAILSFALTIAVIWVNPYRLSNRAFSVVTGLQTTSLLLVYSARLTTTLRPDDYISAFESLLRANSAVLAYLPSSLWFLKSAILSNNDFERSIKSTAPFIVLSTITAIVCYSDTFIYVDHHGILQRGLAYYSYSAMAALVYIFCLWRIAGQMRKSAGIRHVELQYLALNVGLSALILIVLNAIGNYFDVREIKAIGVILMLAASGLTGWALLFHRVLNCQELLAELAQRSTFLLVITLGPLLTFRRISPLVSEAVGIILSIGVFCPVAVWLDRHSRTWFERATSNKLIELRRQVLSVATIKFDCESLQRDFEDIVRCATRSHAVWILLESGAVYARHEIQIEKSCAAVRLLAKLGWATSESIVRRKPASGHNELRHLMATKSCGLALTTPRHSPAPIMLLLIGTRPDEAPFTYPEIRRLYAISEIMCSILARSRVQHQTSIQARLNYFSVGSRGLAHDLRNLITPISSFLEHAGSKQDLSSVEQDAFQAAKHSLSIMNDYVRETLCFSEILEPRFELVDLHHVATSVATMYYTVAASRGVTLECYQRGNSQISGDRVLLHRMIANLVTNAIEASKPNTAVRIAISTLGSSHARLEVSDEGVGIQPEDVPRVLDPYFTTKKGDSDRGSFGLGLTVAHRIALLHQGRVFINSVPTIGTCIAIELPRHPETMLIQELDLVE